MNADYVAEIASMGGIAAHRAGTAHQFTKAEASAAGRLSVQKRHANPSENDNIFAVKNRDPETWISIVCDALISADGSVKGASKSLRVSPSTLRKWIRSHSELSEYATAYPKEEADNIAPKEAAVLFATLKLAHEKTKNAFDAARIAENEESNAAKEIYTRMGVGPFIVDGMKITMRYRGPTEKRPNARKLYYMAVERIDNELPNIITGLRSSVQTRETSYKTKHRANYSKVYSK